VEATRFKRLGSVLWKDEKEKVKQSMNPKEEGLLAYAEIAGVLRLSY
jgi:hypothetical protein